MGTAIRKCEIPGYDQGFSPSGCCGRGVMFGVRKEGPDEVFMTRLSRDLGQGECQYDIILTLDGDKAVELEVVKATGDGVSGEEIQNAKCVLYVVSDRWPKRIAGYNVQAFLSAARRISST